MPERLEALGERLAVKPAKAVQRSSGGVHLPAQAQDAPRRGEVVSVGEDAPSDLLGHHVLYSKYAGLEVEVEGETLLILHKNDVLGRIVDEPVE